VCCLRPGRHPLGRPARHRLDPADPVPGGRPHPDSDPAGGAPPGRAAHPVAEPQPGAHQGRGPVRALGAGGRSPARLAHPARSPAPHRTGVGPDGHPSSQAARAGSGAARKCGTDMVGSEMGSARPWPVSASAGALFVQLMGDKTSGGAPGRRSGFAAGLGDQTRPPAGTGSPASSMLGTIKTGDQPGCRSGRLDMTHQARSGPDPAAAGRRS
jgi:hypothetical protein